MKYNKDPDNQLFFDSVQNESELHRYIKRLTETITKVSEESEQLKNENLLLSQRLSQSSASPSKTINNNSPVGIDQLPPSPDFSPISSQIPSPNSFQGLNLSSKLEAEVKKPIPLESKGQNITEEEISKAEQAIQKYHRMIKILPIGAVIQKAEMEGIDLRAVENAGNKAEAAKTIITEHFFKLEKSNEVGKTNEVTESVELTSKQQELLVIDDTQNSLLASPKITGF